MGNVKLIYILRSFISKDIKKIDIHKKLPKALCNSSIFWKKNINESLCYAYNIAAKSQKS